MEGLGNIVHGPQGEALFLVLDVVEAGDEDDRRVPENDLFLKHFQKLKAVDARHNHVQENQGIVFGFCLCQTFLSRVHHGDFVIRLQNGAEEVRLDRTVVNNQNFFHNRFLPSWMRLRGTGFAAVEDSRISLLDGNYIKCFQKKEGLT